MVALPTKQARASAFPSRTRKRLQSPQLQEDNFSTAFDHVSTAVFTATLKMQSTRCLLLIFRCCVEIVPSVSRRPQDSIPSRLRVCEHSKIRTQFFCPTQGVRTHTYFADHPPVRTHNS